MWLCRPNTLLPGLCGWFPESGSCASGCGYRAPPWILPRARRGGVSAGRLAAWEQVAAAIVQPAAERSQPREVARPVWRQTSEDPFVVPSSSLCLSGVLLLLCFFFLVGMHRTQPRHPTEPSTNMLCSLGLTIFFLGSRHQPDGARRWRISGQPSSSFLQRFSFLFSLGFCEGQPQNCSLARVSAQAGCRAFVLCTQDPLKMQNGWAWLCAVHIPANLGACTWRGCFDPQHRHRQQNSSQRLFRLREPVLKF